MITQEALLERWQNVERVLGHMPAHERERHWNMSEWGRATDCGTIACAAGHCGLDPWFRRRKFRLDFDGGEAVISDVFPFFGAEGSWRIFMNARPRPVETVETEVRDYISELRQLQAFAKSVKTPRIGTPWPNEGGIYAGPRLGVEDAPNYFLIIGPEHEHYATWRDATAWAATVEVDGHKDFTLPSRADLYSCFDNVRTLFQPTWYWSGEQHASGSDCAWGQGFDHGGQSYWGKGTTFRARAVRRLIIR